MFLLKLILKQEIVPKKDKFNIFLKLAYLLMSGFFILGFYYILFDGERDFISNIPFIIRVLIFLYLLISYLCVNPVVDYLFIQDNLLEFFLFMPAYSGISIFIGPFVLLYNKDKIEEIQKEHFEKEKKEQLEKENE